MLQIPASNNPYLYRPFAAGLLQQPGREPAASRVVSGVQTANSGRMFVRLLALFVCMPLIELALLLRIGARLGLGPTLALVIVTGLIGATLAQQQGFKVWSKIRAELQAGRMPAAELVDGLLILIGGVVLITPGLLTDLCGFALMVPAVRRYLRAKLDRRFRVMATEHQQQEEGHIIDI